MPQPLRVVSRGGGQPRAKVREERRVKSFHSVDWTSPEDIVSFVGGMWDTRRARRQWLERQWYINIAFYMGHQWLEWDESRGQLYQPAAPPWRVRLTANLVQGVARKIMATILRQKPVFTVVPATGDPEDIIAARLQEKVLKYYWGGPFEADQKLIEALVWMTTTGLGAWRLHWDPTKSDEVNLSETDVKDESLMKDLKKLKKQGKNKINLGEAVLESKSPFQIDPDPWATRFEDLQWLIDTTMRPVEWVHDRYPDTGKDVGPEDSDDLHFFEKRIADLAGPSSATFTGGRSSLAGVRGDQDMVNVHEVWALPFGKYSRGIYAAVAGDTVLDVRKNQYRANGQVALPYSFFEEIKVPGRLWPTCALEQAISLQAEYNRGRSQIIENRNQMSRPKWLVPEGANVGDYALTSEPGEVVKHTFGHEPKMSTPPPLPNYVIKTLELARSDIQDVTQIHDVSQGKQPGSVRAGKAIVALQEQDASILAPTILCIEKALEKFGGMSMELLSRKIKEERLVKITGKNDLYEVQEFLGTDLIGESKDKPGVNYFDVRVKIGSQLPLTPDARRQFITELAQAGILNAQENPSDKRMLLELLEIGTDEPLYDTARLDFANQRQENRIMLDGIPMEVQDYDDDTVHLEAMINFQKTPEYAERRDEKIDLIFQDHRAQHEQNLALKQQGQGVQEPDLTQLEGVATAEEQLARSVAQARTPLE
jgi:hypothetical protein